jgi:hypothetical protein
MMGPVDIVTALNVFAHADDLGEFADAVRTMLAPDGLFVFEVSYWPFVVERGLFDTVYHEHTSYHTLGPLVPFFRRHGLELVDAELIETHGGSVRGYVRRAEFGGEQSQRLQDLLEVEPSSSRVDILREKIEDARRSLSFLLASLKANGKTVAGYGAPAKLTTLMHALGLDGSTIDFVVDDSPLKQGRVTPGTFIPIFPSSALAERKPDAVVVFCWNFSESVIANNPGHTFIVPLPELRIVQRGEK